LVSEPLAGRTAARATAPAAIYRKQADAANAWVKFLTAPAAAAAFKSRGLEPG